MTIGLVYLGLLGLGVVYALIAGAAGMIVDGGDVHVDASGHLDAGHASPLSPTLIATFITGFGGGGGGCSTTTTSRTPGSPGNEKRPARGRASSGLQGCPE